jgi:hypothetical protein
MRDPDDRRTWATLAASRRESLFCAATPDGVPYVRQSIRVDMP